LAFVALNLMICAPDYDENFWSPKTISFFAELLKKINE
jgi:hypothetical protein